MSYFVLMIYSVWILRKVVIAIELIEVPQHLPVCRVSSLYRLCAVQRSTISKPIKKRMDA